MAMVMTNWEVVNYYNSLKSKKNAVKIIAELNAVPDAKIRVILEDAGVCARKKLKNTRKDSKDWTKVQELYSKGWLDGEIAEAVGYTRSSVAHWRKRHNLPANYKTKAERKMKAKISDPVEIGFCAGCGDTIWSDEEYLVDDAGNMVHADGHFCFVDTLNGKRKIPCAALYFTEICLWDEAVKAMGLERKGA